MKNKKLINSNISRVIAKLGHTDTITISDAGLPIPECVERIDLALSKNTPLVKDVLKAIVSEAFFEEVIIAKEASSSFVSLIREVFKEKIKISYVSHTELKKMTQKTKAIIRTGEFKPFYNMILKSGVVF